MGKEKTMNGQERDGKNHYQHSGGNIRMEEEETYQLKCGGWNRHGIHHRWDVGILTYL